MKNYDDYYFNPQEYDTMDEYQLRDLIKEYFGEMVIDYYLNNADDDDDEFFGFDDDEL